MSTVKVSSPLLEGRPGHEGPRSQVEEWVGRESGPALWLPLASSPAAPPCQGPLAPPFLPHSQPLPWLLLPPAAWRPQQEPV